jgi:hypothetical protein
MQRLSPSDHCILHQTLIEPGQLFMMCGSQGEQVPF